MFTKNLFLLFAFSSVIACKAMFISTFTSNVIAMTNSTRQSESTPLLSSEVPQMVSTLTILPSSSPISASSLRPGVSLSTTSLSQSASAISSLKCLSTVTETLTITATSVIQTTVCSQQVSMTIAPTSSSVGLTPSSSVFVTTTAPTKKPKLSACRVCLPIVVDVPCQDEVKNCEKKNKKRKEKKPKKCNKGKTTGNKGLNIIKKWEKLELKAYKCAAGKWTIGYGHTAGVKKGDVIDKAKADKFLKEDVKCAENAIKREVKVCLSQDQFDALVSFTFNIGIGAFKDSTLLKKLNQGKFDEVPAQMKRWVNANGKKLNGLVKRRKEEAKLFKGKKR